MFMFCHALKPPSSFSKRKGKPFFFVLTCFKLLIGTHFQSFSLIPGNAKQSSTMHTVQAQQSLSTHRGFARKYTFHCCDQNQVIRANKRAKVAQNLSDVTQLILSLYHRHIDPAKMGMRWQDITFNIYSTSRGLSMYQQHKTIYLPFSTVDKTNHASSSLITTTRKNTYEAKSHQPPISICKSW